MIIFALLLYITTTLIVLKTRSPLNIFIFIATNFQFLPLFLTLINRPAAFWHQERYIFTETNPMFSMLVSILIASLLGFIVVSAAFMPRKKLTKAYKLTNSIRDAFPRLDRLLIGSVLLFSAALISLNIYTSGSTFAGYHLTMSLIVGSSFVFYAITQKTRILLLGLLVFIIFLIEQIIGGERDFATIIIALSVYAITFTPTSRTQKITISGFILATIALSIWISVARQNIQVDIYTLAAKIYFNSWSGVMKPLIELLREGGIQNDLLLGKTYLYALISAPPSFMFEMLGYSKPFEEQNPALWYIDKTNGGMHILGVALKNFSLTGVFLQSLSLSLGSLALEQFALKNNSFYSHLLFIAFATAALKGLWYSPINFVNALSFWFFFCGILLIIQIFLKFTLNPKH